MLGVTTTHVSAVVRPGPVDALRGDTRRSEGEQERAVGLVVHVLGGLVVERLALALVEGARCLAEQSVELLVLDAAERRLRGVPEGDAHARGRVVGAGRLQHGRPLLGLEGLDQRPEVVGLDLGLDPGLAPTGSASACVVCLATSTLMVPSCVFSPPSSLTSALAFARSVGADSRARRPRRTGRRAR